MPRDRQANECNGRADKTVERVGRIDCTERPDRPGPGQDPRNVGAHQRRHRLPPVAAAHEFAGPEQGQ
jgi:hypothetical protein